MENPQMPGGIPPEPPYQPTGSQAYTTPPSGYTQQPYPPVGPAASQGLSDTAAGVLAYITIIPAIIFLVMPPYNTRPFVKFHSIQCLGLAVLSFCIGVLRILPFFGWIIASLGYLVLFVIWIMCLVKASQGSYLKIPAISEFAARQSGYTPGMM